MRTNWRTSANILTVCQRQIRCMYLILPSKRPSPCKCLPPIFDDPTVCVRMRCTYKWLLRVSAHPVFWPVNFNCRWALARENTVLMSLFGRQKWFASSTLLPLSHQYRNLIYHTYHTMQPRVCSMPLCSYSYPARVCAGGVKRLLLSVRLCVCLCVCLSVRDKTAL